MKSFLGVLATLLAAANGLSMLTATVQLPGGPADLRLASQQRPEDAVDDFVMDQISAIGEGAEIVCAAVLPYLCGEVEKMRATGATQFLACDGRPVRQVLTTLDVSDLALPVTTVRLREGYSLSRHAAILCAAAGTERGCTPAEEEQLRLRLNADYIHLVSTGPPDELSRHFIQAATEPNDIFEHTHMLQFYALQCGSILQLGVGNSAASYAFLYGMMFNGLGQKSLRSVDIVPLPQSPMHRLARENGLEFSHEVTEDLHMAGLQPVDLTFVDTWHVYGHLKRELQKFSPFTKKWIMIHGTETYGQLGESVWDPSRNATLEHLQGGYPAADIVKGLLPALEEFIAAHPDWVVETTRKSQNGMIVLKRVSGEPWVAPIPPFMPDRPLAAVSKVDVFLITYIVDTPVSIFTPSQRYDQAVHTVTSIRQRYPSAIIVVLDASASEGRVVRGADLTFRHPGPSAFTPNRGVGETYIMQSFLESQTFSALAPFARMVHKISARYALDERYDNWRLGESCVNAASTKNHPLVLSPSVHETIYYTFPPSFANPLVKELVRTRQLLFDNPATSLEDSLFTNFFALGLMCSHDVVGVSGVQAPTGLMMVI